MRHRPERIEVVINRYDGGNGRITTKDVQETFRKPVFATIPNDYQFVARSIDFGRPIAALDRNNPVRVALRKIAKKVMAEGGAEPVEANERRGFLSKFLQR